MIIHLPKKVVFTFITWNKTIFILLFLMQINLLFSQKAIQNQANWFAYTGQYKVSQKWGVHLEAQFRMDGDLEVSRQNLFRLGAIYYPSKNSNFIAGYGLINTLNPSVNAYFKENRIWEQYQHTYQWSASKNTMINRFRLEQRFVDKVGLVDQEVARLETNYQNRFRYLNRNLFFLTTVNKNKDELYAIVQDEVFLNVGSNNVNRNFFYQNRLFLGFGLLTNANFRIEVGYLNHFVNPNSGADTINHTISVSLLHNLTF
jgi:hypothetical protein